MNDKQIGEMRFWSNLLEEHGHSGFIELRKEGLGGVLAWFPELLSEHGWGLDFGCGPISLFEFTELNMDACDPLLEQYNTITGYLGHIRYLDNPVGCYNFIVCKNVIDHDPDPWAIVEELDRLLVPGGKLYFEVNFDPELYSECHYTLWRIGTVREYLERFELIREKVHTEKKHPGIEFYTAIYRKL